MCNETHDTIQPYCNRSYRKREKERVNFVAAVCFSFIHVQWQNVYKYARGSNDAGDKNNTWEK